MDSTKGTTYNHVKKLKFKKSDAKIFTWNDILNKVIDAPVLIAISPNETCFLKNEHGCTGDLGGDEVLAAMLSILGDSISYDVKMFKESFLNDLYEAVKKVLEIYIVGTDMSHKGEEDGSSY